MNYNLRKSLFTQRRYDATLQNQKPIIPKKAVSRKARKERKDKAGS
jgi:hypothetical protein